MSEENLTYARSGVDIEGAERALRGIGSVVKATHNDRVLGGIGGFGAMFQASFPEYNNPVLVSSIDGVGTKVKVAAMAGQWNFIGHDIVNHCVNDILCQGAKPLFFLDYFGCSRLNESVFNTIITGAAEACQKVGCALIGGETAEMPGVYHDDEIDIVGAITGLVDFEKKLPKKPQEGDRIIGLASNGLHTNGYTLARRALFEVGGMSVRDTLPGTDDSLADALLRPHTCYFEPVAQIMEEFTGIYGLAHITGGGLSGNVPRALPVDLQAVIHKRNWEPLQIFRFIQAIGAVPDDEMYRTFNMGIGMVV